MVFFMGLDELLEIVDNLPYEEEAVFLDVLNRRFAEKSRNQFIQETLESKEEYRQGNYSKGTSEDLFKALNL